MSQSDEGQPLSRRERRLREMVETGAVPTALSEDSDTDVASEALEFEPEISPNNPDGSVRSRRELRELREEAIAEHQEQELASTQSFTVQELEEAVAVEPEAEAEIDATSEADDDLAVLTELFEEQDSDDDEDDDAAEAVATDLIAVEDVAAEEDVADADESESSEAQLVETELSDDADVVEIAVEDDAVEEDDDAAEDDSAENYDEDEDNDDDNAVVVDESSEVEDEAEAAEDEAVEIEAVEIENAADAAIDEGADADFDEDVDAETDVFTAKPAARDGYSFPDIAPLDDSISVFDNPESPSALRAADAGDQSDFDDLITSAVAQERSGSSTNTSALILPNMGHTGQLSGPLGETGELFVTGSFELPKSLGETGGHARLLDSVDEDADDLPAAAFGSTGDDGGMAPVSAANAVSARSTGSMVSSPVTEKSRVPAALIVTGGGLIIIIAGLAVWAASTGFFA